MPRRLPRVVVPPLLLLVALAVGAVACDRGDNAGRSRATPAIITGTAAATVGTTATVAPTATPRATATATPTATSAPTATAIVGGPVPRLDAAPCPFKPASGQVEGRTVRCGFVAVAEDHARPDGAVIQLAVAVFQPSRPGTDRTPLFFLDGGPGGYTLDGLGALLTPLVVTALAGGRELVVFDQRGVGYSRPSLACPEVTAAKYAAFDRRVRRDEDTAEGSKAAAACRDRLRAGGVHPEFYTSAQNAADVNDIRVVLGYERINLYGVSYGTRLGLTVERDFPDILRAVVLDSVVPPQADLYPDIYGAAQRSFDLLFQGCAADAACNAAYPGLEGAFYDLVHRLNDQPVPVRFVQKGQDYTYLLTGDRLVSALFQMLYQSNVIPDLPRMITALRNGDTLPFREDFSALLFYDQISYGMYFSVQCGEEMSFTSRQAVENAARGVRPEIGAETGDGFGDDALFPICALWGAHPAAAAENQPVRAATPTLILSGQYDPITPPAYAALAASTLAHATVVEFPGLGHGPGLSDPCALSVMVAFLDAPQRAPDTSCLVRLRGPRWHT